MKLQQLFESDNHKMIVVDIQPFYHKYHQYITPKLVEWINESSGDILWYHNGCNVGIEDTVNEQKEYLLEHGMDEDRLEDIEFEEKDYAFFRGWMDTGKDEDDIITVGKYMLKHHKGDSRDLEEEDYIDMGYSEEEADEFIGHSDPLIIPDIDLNRLKRYNGAYLCGGGRNECLEEIRLLMEMLGMRYKLLNKFIYAG